MGYSLGSPTPGSNPPSIGSATGSGLTPKGEEDNKKAERAAAIRKQSMEYTAESTSWMFQNAELGDPQIAEVLKDQTMRVGIPGVESTYMDTGIPLHPKVLATMVGVGDQIGDSARGIAQLLKENGLADIIDTETQDQNEHILRKLYDDEVYGFSSKVGAVVGAVAEPVGLVAAPLAGAQKLKNGYQAAMYMGAAGGLYGSSLYVDGNESRMANAAMTAMIMGPLGYAAWRFSRQAVGSKVDDIIAAEGAKLGRARIPVPGKPHITPKASQLWKQEIKASQKIDADIRKANKNKVVDPEQVLEDIEVRASMTGARHSKWQQSKNMIDQAIRPLYDVVNKLVPKAAARLRNMDGYQHVHAKAWTDRTKGWNDLFHSMPIESQKKMHLQLAGGVNKQSMAYIQQELGEKGVSAMKEVQEVLDDILKGYKDIGYKINPRADYYPTSVRPEGLQFLVGRQQDQINKILAKEAKRQGRALTEKQKEHIIERLVTFDVRYSNTSGNLKKRIMEDLTEEQVKHYHDPITALHYYVSSAAEDIAKRRFFKGFGHKVDGRKGLDVTGADIDDSIDSLIDTVQAELKSADDVNELVNTLRARFSSDVHHTHRAVQAIKNLSYAGTLGNFWSALTQLGDLIFAYHKYGIRAAAESMFGAKIATKETLGIDKAMIELNSARGATSKLADWAFKLSGFDAIDRFGKNVNINASLRANKRLATKNPDKFKAKWGNAFGEETDMLMNQLKTMELKKGANLSENMKLMLWNDLADTQPIGLSEMPRLYLENPNGRILYAYKTFTMKQFNYMRNRLIRGEGNAFQRGVDMAYFATLFVMANGSIDMFKQFMGGKEMDINDAVFDNMVGLFGTSKYAVDKSQGLGDIILEGLSPVPITQIGKVVNKASTGDISPGDVINQLPIAGKINREFEIFK